MLKKIGTIFFKTNERLKQSLLVAENPLGGASPEQKEKKKTKKEKKGKKNQS